MKRITMVVLGALCALFISGCASQTDYYKAILAIESARAEADKAKWEAVKAGMAKATPEGAGMSAIAIALGGKVGDSPQTQIAPPRSGWDYFIQGIGAVGQIAQVYGNVITPIRLAQEARKTSEAQSKEQTAQVAAQQGTLQFAFGAQRDVGIAGINRPTPVTPPSPPTSQIIVTANTGPVQVGSGTQANSSYNPINPTPLPPRICTTNAAGVLTCQGG